MRSDYVLFERPEAMLTVFSDSHHFRLIVQTALLKRAAGIMALPTSLQGLYVINSAWFDLVEHFR